MVSEMHSTIKKHPARLPGSTLVLCFLWWELCCTSTVCAQDWDWDQDWEYEYPSEVDTHPPLTIFDICGTWHESPNSCFRTQCEVRKFSRTFTQFTTRPTDGEIQPKDKESADLLWYDYFMRTAEFDNEYCDMPKHEVFSMKLVGEFALPFSQEFYGWTEIELLPHTYVISISDKYDDSYIQSFPDGTCENALTYLNTYCPCGGEWAPGLNRTITMDMGKGAPNYQLCEESRPDLYDCYTCKREDCGILYDLRLFGNMQMSDPNTLLLTPLQPEELLTTSPSQQEQTVLKRNFDDGANGYNGCKNYYPSSRGDDVSSQSLSDHRLHRVLKKKMEIVEMA